MNTTTTKHPSPKPATPAMDAARMSAAAERRAQALSATADAWRHVAISSGDAVESMARG